MMMQRTANENAAYKHWICKRSDLPKIMQGWYHVKSWYYMIIWIFPIVPWYAFCMWHWPIDKDLDLSFIWGHHHLSEYMDISRPTEYFIACYTVLTRPNRGETAVHGCNCWLSVSLPRWAFHVVSALHCLLLHLWCLVSRTLLQYF